VLQFASRTIGEGRGGSMLQSEGGICVRRIELYENERYSPVVGWSPKSLGMTDRKALSNHDGTEGFDSLEEANQSLLPKGIKLQNYLFYFLLHLCEGWQWDANSSWSVDKQLTDIDADGWSYCTDFTSYSSEITGCINTLVTTAGAGKGTGQKGMMHFVRRRKLVRDQVFDSKFSLFS
jgi:hypothetical protein